MVNDSHAHVSFFLPSSTDATSVSAHAPLRADEGLTDAPPLDDNNSLTVQPASENQAEDRRIPSSSPNPVTTRTIHGTIDILPRSMGFFTPEFSASLPPSESKASTSPPDAIVVEPSAVNHAALGHLNAPTSASLELALDEIFSTGLVFPSDSAVVGSDLIRRC